MNPIGIAALLSVVLSASTVMVVHELGLLSSTADGNTASIAGVTEISELRAELDRLKAEVAASKGGAATDAPAMDPRVTRNRQDIDSLSQDMRAMKKHQADVFESLKAEAGNGGGAAVSNEQLDAMIQARMAEMAKSNTTDLEAAKVREVVEAMEEQERVEREERRAAEMKENYTRFRENLAENVRENLNNRAEELGLTTAQIDDVANTVTTRVDSIANYLETVRQQRASGIEVSNDVIKTQIESLQEQSTASLKLALSTEQFDAIDNTVKRYDGATLWMNGVSARDLGIDTGMRGFAGRGGATPDNNGGNPRNRGNRGNRGGN